MLLVLVVMVIAVTSCFALVACRKEGYLYVATNAEFPPFEYTDGREIVGFDVDFLDALAKDMGYKGVVFKHMDFETVILNVQNGQYDCGAAGLTIKPERLEQVDFTDTYFAATQTMLYKGQDMKFASKEAAYNFMKGKKIATILGYTGDSMIKDQIDESFGALYQSGATMETYKNGALAVSAMVNGAVDVVVIDNYPAKKLAEQNADKGVICDTNALGDDESYAICLKKGNAELLAKFNTSIAKMKLNGVYDALVAKYFG